MSLMSRIFYCSLCQESFAKYKDLRYHRFMHSNKKLFNCYLCDFVSHYKSNVTRHLRVRHLTGRPYLCVKCGSVLKCETCLANHLKKECKFNAPPIALGFLHPQSSQLPSMQCTSQLSTMMYGSFIQQDISDPLVYENTLYTPQINSEAQTWNISPIDSRLQ